MQAVDGLAPTAEALLLELFPAPMASPERQPRMSIASVLTAAALQYTLQSQGVASGRDAFRRLKLTHTS